MLVDVLGTKKKHEIMSDTWGHLYPENNSKHKGVIIVSTGGSSFNVLDRYFKNLECSPIEFELVCSIDKYLDLDWSECALYEIECNLCFSDNADEMYLGESIGYIEVLKVNCLHKYDFNI